MKLIIFDFDGTIANTLPVAIKVGNELAPKYLKKKVDFKKVFYSKGVGALIKETKTPAYKVLLIARRFRKQMKKYFDTVKIDLGMKNLVRKFRSQGYIVGLVTSNSRHNVKTFLSRYDMRDDFDFIKTNVSLFTKAWRIKRSVRKYRIAKDQAYVIGDETRDIDAAKKAGVRSVAVVWGMNSRKLLRSRHPDKIVNTAEQIYDWIERN